MQKHIFEVVTPATPFIKIGDKYELTVGSVHAQRADPPGIGHLSLSKPHEGGEYEARTVAGTCLRAVCYAGPPTLPPAVPHDGKDDTGKSDPSLLFRGCANALKQVCLVLDGGAKKYAADSWQQVPNGIQRYWKAFERHKQEVDIEGLWSVNTKDFGLLNIDHMITDLLFVRELMHKEAQKNGVVSHATV